MCRSRLGRILVVAGAGAVLVSGAPTLAQEETDLTREEIDALLLALTNREDLLGRTEALRTLLDAGEGAREALAERLLVPRTIDPGLIERLVGDYLRMMRAELPEGSPVPARTSYAPLLHVLLVTPHEVYEDTWAAVIETVAILGALDRIDTREAIEDMIRLVGINAGAFARAVSVGIQAKGDRAVPALVRARKNPNADVRAFAAAQLARMGKERAPLMAQVADERLLAEILDAIGEVRDPDGMNVMLSFINSDRPLVRKAARRALRGYERNAIWKVREAYEDFVGERAEGDWEWDETMDRLFAAMDAARFAPLDGLLAEALADAAEGRHEEMSEKFGTILAGEPEYPRRAEMVPGLLAYGERLLGEGRILDARRILRMASYLAPDDTAPSKRIRAHLAYLEGLRRRDLGFPDPAPFREAASLDEDYARLIRSRGDLTEEEVRAARAGGGAAAPGGSVAGSDRSAGERPAGPRIAVAAAIAVLAVAALLMLVSWGRFPGRLLPWPSNPAIEPTDRHVAPVAEAPASGPVTSSNLPDGSGDGQGGTLERSEDVPAQARRHGEPADSDRAADRSVTPPPADAYARMEQALAIIRKEAPAPAEPDADTTREKRGREHGSEG